MIDQFFIKYNQKQWAVLELTARDFIINGAFLPPRGSAKSFFWQKFNTQGSALPGPIVMYSSNFDASM